jgi:hypothetical protein
MLAIINQAKGYTAASGQGTINSTLYTLAANSTTYASAFHDITSGGNECAAGTTYCGTGAQTTEYLAGTGYDEASGLGSVDLYNLLTCLLVLGTLAGAVSGCGSGGSTGSGGGTDASPGTYSMTITGTDSLNSSITGSAGFMLTIN